MKKLFSSLFSLLIIAGMISSCKKDSEQPKNEFTVGSESYTVDTLGLYYSGANASGQVFWVELISPGIILSESGNFYNAGSFLELDVVTTSTSGIASGEYTYTSQSYSDAQTMTVTSNSCYCTNWVSGSSNTYISVSSGTLTVTRDGSDYTLSFTGTDESGKTITAYYAGEGVFYDFSVNKSASRPGAN